MKSIVFAILLLLLPPGLVLGQAISINTDGSNPAPSAILDVKSTDKGVLVPRMTSAQRTMIAAPATGLLVFDITTNGFWLYNGMIWSNLSSPGVLSDSDGDTKIQVEKNIDEDIIRLDLAGSERLLLRRNLGNNTILEFPNNGSCTFIGAGAGNDNTTGASNTALGLAALYSNTNRSHLVAVGDSTLYNNGNGATQAIHAIRNTAIGAKALFANTTGFYNTATGYQALYSNTSGNTNAATGAYSLSVNTTGYENAALGTYTLYSNSTGYRNTVAGLGVMFLNTIGHQNTAIGYHSMYANTTGNDNIAAGLLAMLKNTTGSNNTAIGGFSLYSNSTGSNNTALGYGAEVTDSNFTNATALGNFATVNASNKVRIGNADVTVIEGQVDWTFPSDARFKFNVRDDRIPGLAFIQKLRPVTYQFDTRKFDEHLVQQMPDSIRQRRVAQQDYSASSTRVQTGFLAQEVERACQELNFEFSGLHVPASAADNYGLAYGSFVPLLVKGMQEQQVLIEAQAAEMGRMKKMEAENAALKAQLETQKAQLDAQAAQIQQITAALQTAGIGIGN